MRIRGAYTVLKAVLSHETMRPEMREKLAVCNALAEQIIQEAWQIGGDSQAKRFLDPPGESQPVRSAEVLPRST